MSWFSNKAKNAGANEKLEKVWKGERNQEKQEKQENQMKFPDVIVNPDRQRVVVNSDGKPELTQIPAQVLALKDVEGGYLERALVATELMQRGFVIDVMQDAWGTKPYLLIEARRRYGITWVPSLMRSEAMVLGPGIFRIGDQVYDPQSPAVGAILVPPYGHAIGDLGVVPPEPEPEPENPPVSPIGPPAGGSRYLLNPLSKDQTPNGGTIVVDGVTYKKVMQSGFAGITTIWWERQ